MFGNQDVIPSGVAQIGDMNHLLPRFTIVTCHHLAPLCQVSSLGTLLRIRLRYACELNLFATKIRCLSLYYYPPQAAQLYSNYLQAHKGDHSLYYLAGEFKATHRCIKSKIDVY